jgi:hypothetical protein
MSIRGMQISYQQKVNNLGYMVPLLFQMIDMKDNFLTSQFDSLVLGQQLLQWSMLTNSPAIHHLWMEKPALAQLPMVQHSAQDALHRPLLDQSSTLS